MKYVETVLLKYSNFLSIPPSWIKAEIEILQDAALYKIAYMSLLFISGKFHACTKVFFDILQLSAGLVPIPVPLAC